MASTEMTLQERLRLWVAWLKRRAMIETAHVVEEAAAELDRLQARVAELEEPEMNELTDEQIEAALKGAGINIGLDDGTPGYRFIMMAAFNAVVAAARKAKP